MRAQIDIPVYTSTDINKVTSIIQQVSKDNIENYPEIIRDSKYHRINFKTFRTTCFSC